MNPVDHILALAPYGMLLTSLGTCTAIVLHTYAQHHGMDLREVELRLAYERNFDQDCEHCEHIGQYEEHIEEELLPIGDLTPEQ